MVLGQEMITMFDAEVLVALKPGAGEMLKAALAKHIWAGAVCKDVAQKGGWFVGRASPGAATTPPYPK